VVYTKEIMMDLDKLTSVIQMAEAHLLNVQNELQKLHTNKQQIENKISEYNKYLTDSAEDVKTVRSSVEPTNTPMPE
jgi:chaperonin cofactor prefoldin